MFFKARGHRLSILHEGKEHFIEGRQLAFLIAEAAKAKLAEADRDYDPHIISDGYDPDAIYAAQ